MLDAIDAASLVHSNAEVTMVPSTEAQIDKDHAETFIKLVDSLEDLDDVQQVYHNGQIPDDVAESL